MALRMSMVHCNLLDSSVPYVRPAGSDVGSTHVQPAAHALQRALSEADLRQASRREDFRQGGSSRAEQREA